MRAWSQMVHAAVEPREGSAVPHLIFVSLPVIDVAASRAFFAAIGHQVDDRFCDADAVCVVISPTIYVMLLSREAFAVCTPRRVADAHATTETLLCLSADSPEDVDEHVRRALAAGGEELRTLQERDCLGVPYLYGRSYADLDGHVWEVLWTDPSPV